jgi:hypothetical protein
MNEKLSSLMEEMQSLTETLKSVKFENEVLRNTTQSQANQIAELRNVINDRELHARSWSIRAINIPIPSGQESNNKVVMEKVYKELLVPILERARASGEVSAIPPCFSLIEPAHIRPGKGNKKPVIIRFFSRFWRSLLFKHRKEYAPREPTALAPAPSSREPSENTPGCSTPSSRT